MILDVTYMSGAGNLFTVIDLRKFPFSDEELSVLARLLCNPNQFNGIRTEGFLGVDNAIIENTDFSVKFFNPDGSSGMMCGNGGRCAIRFARRHQFTSKDELAFSLAETIYYGNYGEIIDIHFPPPESVTQNVKVEVLDKEFVGDFIQVGTEHFVAYLQTHSIEEFKRFEVDRFGRALRFSKLFAPRGTNANFYTEWNGKLLLRTYERGVEAETGACGTGAISTAIAYSIATKFREKIDIIPSSGLPLSVKIIRNEVEEIVKIILSGHAEVIGSQDISIPDNFVEIYKGL